MMNTLFSGVGFETFALTLMRVGLGFFFVISGFHKIRNPVRHAALVETLRQCGVPYLNVTQWFVPGVEFFGGLALVVGLLTPLAAAGLFAICLVATCTDGFRRVRSEKPIDKADEVDDVLYLPEVLFLFMLAYFIAAGAGTCSFDCLVRRLL